MLRSVRRRVRVIGGVTALAAEGGDRLEAVRYATARGEQRLAADLLLLHHGVVPNVTLAMAAGIPHCWDEAQACFVPERGEAGATTLDGIAIAGDGGGIGGAEAAAEEGRLAAIAAIRALRPGADFSEVEAAARRGLARWRRGRRFLDALYRPAFAPPAGDTIVCRCEAVTAREIAAAVAQGCAGPNQLKAFTRCGMGPCQGRMCGITVTQLIAALRGISPAAVGHYRLRPPVKPLTLGELAGLPASNAAMKTVARD